MKYQSRARVPMTRVRFYVLLPTSKNFSGSLPTKTRNMYSASYALMIVEVKVTVIVIDVIVQASLQIIAQRAFCRLSSLCRQLYFCYQLSSAFEGSSVSLTFVGSPAFVGRYAIEGKIVFRCVLYKRVCPSIGPSVRRSVGRSVGPSHTS